MFGNKGNGRKEEGDESTVGRKEGQNPSRRWSTEWPAVVSDRSYIIRCETPVSLQLGALLRNEPAGCVYRWRQTQAVLLVASRGARQHQFRRVIDIASSCGSESAGSHSCFSCRCRGAKCLLSEQLARSSSPCGPRRPGAKREAGDRLERPPCPCTSSVYHITYTYRLQSSVRE